MRKINEINMDIRNANIKKFAAMLEPKVGIRLCAQKIIGGIAIITPVAIIGVVGMATKTLPFYRDYLQAHEYTRIECNSDGECNSTSRYESFSTNSRSKAYNKFTLYGKWTQREDGTYMRTVEKYNVIEKSYEEVKELFEGEDTEVRDFLGEPSMVTEQYSDNPEDLDRGAYFEATFYSEDKNKTITVRETKYEDIGDITAWALGGVVLAIFTMIGYKCFQASDFYQKTLEIDHDSEYMATSRLINSLKQEKELAEYYTKNK